MKKILIILVVGILSVGFIGCGSDSASEDSDSKVSSTEISEEQEIINDTVITSITEILTENFKEQDFEVGTSTSEDNIIFTLLPKEGFMETLALDFSFNKGGEWEKAVTTYTLLSKTLSEKARNSGSNLNIGLAILSDQDPDKTFLALSDGKVLSNIADSMNK